jgi:hypothetical protein
VNQFIDHLQVVTTISSYTVKVTVNIAYVTSHTKSSSSYSGHIALPLEVGNSSQFRVRVRVLCYDRRSVSQSVLE